MAKTIAYNKLEIKGSLLVPGFSIYLFEIVGKGKPLYYVGMTGDPFYPSARAAFHRISGHLELTSHSTQNQIMKALKQKFGAAELETIFPKLIITMHHYPIGGFEKWKYESLSADDVKKHRTEKEYVEYKKRQTVIEEFEDFLIFELRERIGDRLLNKTEGKSAVLKVEFKPLYDDIIDKIK